MCLYFYRDEAAGGRSGWYQCDVADFRAFFRRRRPSLVWCAVVVAGAFWWWSPRRGWSRFSSPPAFFPALPA